MGKVYKTTTGLNLRKGPGIQYDVVKVLPKGSVVEELNTQVGWCPILGGWVSRTFLVPSDDVPFVEPKHLTIARGELGTKEIYGTKHNRRIVEYHQTCTLKATDDETPWCSAFVNWCVTKAGLKGTNSAAAISWTSWGKSVQLANAQPGDIVVFSRTGGNHVGFYISHDDSAIRVLGGNQSDEVNIATFSRARFLSLRRVV